MRWARHGASSVCPSLGADMESGILLEWLVRPGDTVHKGDIVAVVDTSKAAVEVECFERRRRQRLLVEPGTRVPVGDALAAIEGARPRHRPLRPASRRRVPPGEATPEAEPRPHPTAHHRYGRRPEQLHVDTATIAGTGVRRAHHPRATSAAGTPSAAAEPRPCPGVAAARRRRARRGVGWTRPRHRTRSPASIRAGMPGGRAGGRAGEPNRPRTRRPRRCGATIAALMARSKREIPHYYLTDHIDLGPATDWLHERNRRPCRSPSDSCRPHCCSRRPPAPPRGARPQRFLDRRRLRRPRTGVHLGVAVSLRGGGLVAPAIRDADALDLTRLMAALRDLVDRTRAGRLRAASSPPDHHRVPTSAIRASSRSWA